MLSITAPCISGDLAAHVASGLTSIGRGHRRDFLRLTIQGAEACVLCYCAGKTLIARQIGKMLNGKEPKIVNGPEVLNKYVGASEENVPQPIQGARCAALATCLSARNAGQPYLMQQPCARAGVCASVPMALRLSQSSDALAGLWEL